jgi:uncharacterized protein (DUF1810 family)
VSGDAHDLARFVTAQDDGCTYDRALGELRRGQKRSHWMWFIFPQLAGLGRSATAQRYALTGLEQARAYLAHPVLGSRLRACCEALTALETSDPVAALGPVDAVKLRSSLTLFAAADPDEPLFDALLRQLFAGERDSATVALLG